MDVDLGELGLLFMLLAICTTRLLKRWLSMEKGNEKIVRILLKSKRNYPSAVKRSTWKDRGQNSTELGILIRSVRNDEMSYNNVLHFLRNSCSPRQSFYPIHISGLDHEVYGSFYG